MPNTSKHLSVLPCQRDGRWSTACGKDGESSQNPRNVDCLECLDYIRQVYSMIADAAQAEEICGVDECEEYARINKE